jgi:chromosome segregation ATPase
MNEMGIRKSDELEQLTPEQLGGEIRLLTSQARKIVLAYAVEIGHRLVLAKEKVGHGEWIDWVARETTLSQSSANRMMRLYEEYGNRQESLFGAEVNSSTLTNLSVSNALQLLAYPPEEREQAAAELDAEHLSSRELAEAIAARKAAEDRAAELQKELDEIEDGHGLAITELEEKIDEMRSTAEKGRAAIKAKEELEEKLDIADLKVKELREQIKELEARPIATVKERDEEAIEQAVTVAKAKADAEAAEKISAIQKKLEKAEKDRDKFKDAAGKAESGAAEKVAAAEKDAAAARQELEEARKKLKASNANVAVFGAYFKAIQENYNRMLEKLQEIGTDDRETADKLRGGAKVILTQMLERITA